jgi:glycosyltransferase involved in cell wall biosynthesis
VHPRVSILIPVHNGRPWITAALQSANTQTWDNTEVIVLDDGSTDGSLEVARAFVPAVRVETQNNHGQNVSRNRLTALSTGEWLVYLDADDELAPDAVEKKMAVAANADAVYGSMNLRWYRDQDVVSSRVVAAAAYDDDPLAAAFLWKYPNTSAFMFRRQAVLDAGGWNEAIHNCTDYDMYFKLLLAEKRVLPAPDSLSVYRLWHASQATVQNAMRLTATRLDVMWRAAASLDASQRWTDTARTAFSAATLSTIRVMYLLDPAQSLVEHGRLRAWNPRLKPPHPFFSNGYRTAYRLFGFRGAERVAWAARMMRPVPLPVGR